jgi:hypothetical protein
MIKFRPTCYGLDAIGPHAAVGLLLLVREVFRQSPDSLAARVIHVGGFLSLWQRPGNQTVRNLRLL